MRDTNECLGADAAGMINKLEVTGKSVKILTLGDVKEKKKMLLSWRQLKTECDSGHIIRPWLDRD